MKYNKKEKQFLSLLNSTDFKSLSKKETVDFASEWNKLRPEAQTSIITQFPIIVDLIKGVATEYKGAIDSIIRSDDSSVNQVYGIINKEMDNANESRKEYYGLANKVQSDLSKCLDRDDLTYEQQKEIRDQEMDVLHSAEKKDSEILVKEKSISQGASTKDSEKRQFNWGLILSASAVALSLVNVIVGFNASKFNANPPIKK